MGQIHASSAAIHLTAANHGIAMILRPALLVLALAASSLARGEALDPPERIARLSYAEGRVMFQGPGDASPSGLPDRPLMPGDRLTTERDARAELALGTATIRLNEQTEFSVIALDAATVRIELTAGSAIVHLRELFEDESFEFVTPNATIAMHSAGEYRVNVFADDATELTVRAGAAEVTTTGGPVRIADGQRVRLEGRDALASLAAPLPADAFDDWVLEREVQLAEAQPPPGETLEGYEDEALNDYGEWYDEPNYGRVWMPSYAYGGYDPFRYGHWQHVGLWLVWVDTMPWGFYTSNYGRWAYLHHRNRWCWVPTRRDHGRHFAHDTRPYRRPRDDARQRDDRRDSRPDVPARRDDDERRPSTTLAELPRRIDADLTPAYRRDVESVKQSRGGTVVPSTNGGQNPPPRTTPVRQSGGTTMAPARPAESSSQTSSRPATTTTTTKAFGKPQIP